MGAKQGKDKAAAAPYPPNAAYPPNGHGQQPYGPRTYGPNDPYGPKGGLPPAGYGAGQYGGNRPNQYASGPNPYQNPAGHQSSYAPAGVNYNYRPGAYGWGANEPARGPSSVRPPSAPGRVLDLDPSTFNATVLDPHRTAVVAFYALWCNTPYMANLLDSVSGALSKHPDIVVARVDADNYKDIFAHYDGKTLPALFVFPKHDKSGIEYLGDRNENEILNFIHYHHGTPGARAHPPTEGSRAPPPPFHDPRDQPRPGSLEYGRGFPHTSAPGFDIRNYPNHPYEFGIPEPPRMDRSAAYLGDKHYGAPVAPPGVRHGPNPNPFATSSYGPSPSFGPPLPPTSPLPYAPAAAPMASLGYDAAIPSVYEYPAGGYGSPAGFGYSAAAPSVYEYPAGGYGSPAGFGYSAAAPSVYEYPAGGYGSPAGFGYSAAASYSAPTYVNSGAAAYSAPTYTNSALTGASFTAPTYTNSMMSPGLSAVPAPTYSTPMMDPMTSYTTPTSFATPTIDPMMAAPMGYSAPMGAAPMGYPAPMSF